MKADPGDPKGTLSSSGEEALLEGIRLATMSRRVVLHGRPALHPEVVVARDDLDVVCIACRRQAEVQTVAAAEAPAAAPSTACASRASRVDPGDRAVQTERK